MDFKMRMDPGALVNLPDVKGRTITLRADDAELYLQFGEEFEAHIPRSSIAGTEQLADPRPTVFFPMGISAAVERFGRDTLCIVASHDGLVQVNFNGPVQGTTSPPNYMGKTRTIAEGSPIEFRSLILSLEDPQGFTQALAQRGSAAAARPVT